MRARFVTTRFLIATFACLSLLGFGARAGDPAGVYSRTTSLPLDQAYTRLYEALEAERFWVVFETDMGSRMESMRERWGADYNRHNLTGVRSMVFCNLDWTHRVANAAPELLALCPLHLSVYGQDGHTVVVMPRPSVIAAGSDGATTASELETQLIGVIDAALRGD